MLLDNIKKHLDAYSAANWDDYKASLADDTIYEEPSTRLLVQGADEVIKTVQRWKRAFPDLTAKVLGGFESGDKVVAEVEWEGTHTGPLDGPFGTMQATNKKGRVRGVLVLTMKDGKISENRHYFDLMTILTQIGAIPALGAPQPSEKVGEAASPKH